MAAAAGAGEGDVFTTCGPEGQAALHGHGLLVHLEEEVRTRQPAACTPDKAGTSGRRDDATHDCLVDSHFECVYKN